MWKHYSVCYIFHLDHRRFSISTLDGCCCCNYKHYSIVSNCLYTRIKSKRQIYNSNRMSHCHDNINMLMNIACTKYNIWSHKTHLPKKIRTLWQHQLKLYFTQLFIFIQIRFFYNILIDAQMGQSICYTVLHYRVWSAVI